MAYKETWLQYDHDLVAPPVEEIGRLARWADLINVHADTSITPTLLDKPIIMTYHGSYYRRRWQPLNARDRTHGFLPTALTIDLAMHGPRWIGRAMPDLGYSQLRHDEFTVVHSPTQPRRKGTALVRQACADLGVRLDVITRVPHAECMARKARGHVLVDQVGPTAYGYGTSALEAWALGMPVISGCSDALFRAIVERVEMCPFVRASSTRELRDAIRTLREDQAEYDRWATLGKQYLRAHHDPATVARRFVQVCREALQCPS